MKRNRPGISRDPVNGGTVNRGLTVLWTWLSVGRGNTAAVTRDNMRGFVSEVVLSHVKMYAG